MAWTRNGSRRCSWPWPDGYGTMCRSQAVRGPVVEPFDVPRGHRAQAVGQIGQGAGHGQLVADLGELGIARVAPGAADAAHIDRVAGVQPGLGSRRPLSRALIEVDIHGPV